MAIMGKNVWAVMCGAIRMEFEFYTTLAMLCDYRKRGFLEGIVISTWKGELDNFPDLRQKLDVLGIYLIESDVLDERATLFTDGGYLRQIFQLKKGLEFVPNDVFVFKCRTDYSEDLIKDFEDILSGKIDLTVGKHGAINFGLCYRIVVERLIINIPFHLDDRAFLGYALDLKKMINIKFTSIEYGFKFRTDCWFFEAFFVKSLPIIEQIFEVLKSYSILDLEIFHNKIKLYLNTDKKKKESFKLPGIFNKFYALYFILMKCCFYPVLRTEFKLKPFYFSDIFACNIDIGMGRMHLSNIEILRMVVDIECKPTDGYADLCREINRFSMPGYADEVLLTKKDYDETAKWIKEVLNEDPSKWLQWKHIETVKYSNLGFDDAVNILFSNYRILDNKNLSKILYCTCFDRTSSYYHSVSVNLLNIKELDSSLYDITIAAASRAEYPFILKQLAKGLFFNEIKCLNASFIFERWAHSPIRFMFPMPSYKICAYYYYGKYAEPLGKDALPKNFYTHLINKFYLLGHPKPACYADAVLDLIKEIVSLHYKEYKENLSVRYMIDFLADEFYDTVFTQEQWDFLAEYIIDRRYSLPFKEAAPDAFEKLLEGAEMATSELEADIILKLLLREKWNQSAETQKKADIAITKFTEKYLSQTPCFIKANILSKDEILLFNPLEVDREDDFVLLVRILSERKLLANNREVLLQTYGEDSFRRTVIELFLQLEGNKKVKFFSIKNGVEMWMNYTDFLNSRINSEFVFSRNNDWCCWPLADSASLSPFAAFLKLRSEGLFISIEFNSCLCSAKKKLLDNIDKTKVNAYDKNARLICLKAATYPFASADEIGTAVEKALKDFMIIGEMLTDTLKKLE